MKLFNESKSLILAKLWPILEAMRPWNRNNWKYFAVSLFAWLVYFSMYYKNSGETKIVKKISVKKDVSSSIVTMEPLLRVEQKLLQALNEYANQLQRKVDNIRRGIATMRKPPFINNINEEEFLSNPFNSFPMLRRLKHEWKAWEKYIKAPEKTEYIDVIHKTLEGLEDFDLIESARAIHNLRQIYDIQPNDWTDGKLHFGEYEIRFTSLDCYAVAFLLHKEKEYEAADEWFEASLSSYVPKGIYKYLGFNISIIYETYVDNLMEQNRTALALIITKTGLKRDPGNSKLIDKKSFIENLNVTESTSSLKPVFKENESKIEDSIKRGCRGEYAYNATSQLFCYYNWSTNDFVRLAPFKVEEISADPILLLYHDILSDTEISLLKHMAKGKLIRSGVLNTPTKSLNHLSKNAWIEDDINDFTKMLNKRFEDMTGLWTMGTSLFVGNFGLGGHYSLHTDCHNDCRGTETEAAGNCDGRIMTVLVYLSDVESGGATIFPKIESGVPPQKGTAVIWYNLENNMEQCDKRLNYMACPVLFGSKWYFVKWINFKNQMFRKPCFKNDAVSVDEIS